MHFNFFFILYPFIFLVYIVLLVISITYKYRMPTYMDVVIINDLLLSDSIVRKLKTNLMQYCSSFIRKVYVVREEHDIYCRLGVSRLSAYFMVIPSNLWITGEIKIDDLFTRTSRPYAFMHESQKKGTASDIELLDNSTAFSTKNILPIIVKKNILYDIFDMQEKPENILTFFYNNYAIKHKLASKSFRYSYHWFLDIILQDYLQTRKFILIEHPNIDMYEELESIKV